MKVNCILEPEERLTNFKIAEAVTEVCETNFELDAEAVAKMILAQAESNELWCKNG